ncbi:hypothetical protein LTR36_004374 [Oleoguttula mirabilis]|uniref:Uncharacterized protein n=1 Tax=Oleoguttula mirabilis TaxID=1507867 RepID=A0AAV9JG19_9PEZI|nr:hypothetical protein LTR36_004374 [Oleoguttula mirabilis]
MAAPVLVRAYTGIRRPATSAPSRHSEIQALPPVSSYAFADILRSADCPEFQHAIDGIAEICAKNRMSLADEYASHLPPLGEITAATSVAAKPHLLRPGVRRPLTSVPEGSSGSSEGSRRSKKRSRIFGFGLQRPVDGRSLRQMRIGSMGRTISVGSTVALAASDNVVGRGDTGLASGADQDELARPQRLQRTPSEATQSLQRLLGMAGNVHSG